MRETQQQSLLDDEATLVVSGEETTLVSPRFDDEETLVARPVVPLEADAHAAAPEQTPAPVYPGPYHRRRSGMLALALVSVLVGGVLGGAGLYIYQRQSQDPAATSPDPAATTTQTQPDAAQAPPAANAENTTPPESSAQQPSTPTDAAPSAEAAAPPAHAAEVPPAPPAREPENVPAAERRPTHNEGGETATPRRGKKSEHDEETQPRPTAQPNGNVARADAPEARRVDSIFYRPRRANRRARRDDDVDRLRRIFEGTP